jgi:hypothetical protein
MNLHRALASLVALGLAGCGIVSSTPATESTTPAAIDEPQTPSAFAWQSELESAEQMKVTERVWLFLDGDQPEGVETSAEALEPQIRVTAKLRHAVAADDVDYYASFGLDAAEGAEAPSGFVTRAQLLELARDRNVVRLDAPTADEIRAEERQARRRARATSRRRANRM